VTRTELVTTGDGGRLEVVITGDRPDVVLVPSAQRGAADFAQLAGVLRTAGRGSVAVNPRGVAGSSPVTRPATLRALAADVADVVVATVGGPAHLVGHALGNVVVRATAAHRPETVRSVTLLACGGHDLAAAPPSDDLLHHFGRCHRADLPDAERLESLGVVFFAAGNDASSWLTGWWPDSDVREIFDTTDPAEWWTAGDVDVLIVQPLEDPLCPPGMGAFLQGAMGARARLVELPRCSHAILPEQPDAVAAAVLDFLADLDGAP
jgi:pimeloyl-ACP methyl ester carboxylesterase